MMKKTFMQRYLQPLWQNKKFYLGALLHPINKGVFPILTVYIVKLITGFIENGQYESAKSYIYILVGCTVGYYILLLATHKLYFLGSFFLIKRSLQTMYIDKYIKLDNNDAERYGLGRFVAVIKQGIHTRSGSLHNLFFQGGYLFLTLILSFFLILEINYVFALIYLTILLFSLLLSWRLDVGAVYRRDKRRDKEHANSRSVIRLIMSKFEVLQSGKLKEELKALRNYLHEADVYNQKTGNYVWAILNAPEFFMKGIQLFVLLHVGLGVIEGTYTFADFIALISVLIIIEKSVRHLSVFFKDTTKDISYVQKIFDTYDGMSPIIGYEEGNTFTPQGGMIEVKDMSYGYGLSGDNPNLVFSNFSLTFQGGKKTALVGVSGSGKSTLVKLIAGYLRPDAGSILIDGQDLSTTLQHYTTALKTYYPHIGYLTQEPSIFDGTVRDNLTYAVGDDDPGEQIEEAIQMASCEFIYDLPNGLDTEIGERGVRLSGGQRQRLAIAKIFLKNPEIIILDEPTSALDSFSEEAITEAMHKLFEGRTVIIIAHRLQTVKEADEIILLGKPETGNQKPEESPASSRTEGGTNVDERSIEALSESENPQTTGSQVLERGTHEELVALGGQYARMLEVQTGF